MILLLYIKVYKLIFMNLILYLIFMIYVNELIFRIILLKFHLIKLNNENRELIYTLNKKYIMKINKKLIKLI